MYISKYRAHFPTTVAAFHQQVELEMATFSHFYALKDFLSMLSWEGVAPLTSTLVAFIVFKALKKHSIKEKQSFSLQLTKQINK